MTTVLSKTRLGVLAVLFSFVFTWGTAVAQDTKIVSLPKYISNCLFNFSRNINWPEVNRSGNFIVTIVGSKEVYAEMTKLTQGMKVGKQPIEVKYCNTVGEVSGYQQMVYVAGWQCSKLKQLVDKTYGMSTLVVTETEGMTSRGAMIAFVAADGVMRFELSKENLQKSNLLASTVLEKMAL
jgi:hypothetical protein